MVTDSRTKVLVAGGGVAGLEAILALRAIAPGRFDIELVTPQRHVTSRSLAAGPPFLRATADRVELATITAERGVRLTRDALELVEPDLHEVLTQGGARRVVRRARARARHQAGASRCKAPWRSAASRTWSR